ncbi:MAG: cupin domain-containing protein, partial [Deltaproteobacteria bacterium]|nr:cupin domain-containing protein [Deltaproteobacteria bacterium]
DLPEHSHAAQIGIVLEGRIDLTIAGKTKTYKKGDRYFIAGNTGTSSEQHMREDLGIFNFELSSEDLKQVSLMLN